MSINNDSELILFADRFIVIAISGNMSSDISNSTNSITSAPLLNRVKFGVFLSLQIPSVICSVYLFFQYATRQYLRQSIHNHAIIVLLCNGFSFMVIPLSANQAYFFTSRVRPESNLFCAVWTWVHYSLDISNLILMAFVCAERHWLIFRINAMPTRWKRLVCHYIPIGLCMIYPWLFYFACIFLHPCEPAYDYTQLLCLIPCYFFTKSVANLDTFLNNWVPIFAIPLLSGALFVRFLAQKRRMRIDAFRWKRDRRMIIQLLSITLLYCLTWGPLQAATVYNNFFNDGMASPFVVDYLYSFPCFVYLLYPFVLLLSNPELQWRSRRVQPQENLELRPTVNTNK